MGILRRNHLLFAGLLLLASPATAAWYKVELLLFLNNDPIARAGESAPGDPGSPVMFDALPLQGAGAAFELLPESRRELNPHRLQLQRSGRYRPLLHLAWTQPVDNRRNARKVFFETADYAAGEPALIGTLRLYRGRFLHADLDVRYSELPAAAAESEQSVYRMLESRRMRSGELHYLDHPAIGALITVQPLSNEPRSDNASDEPADTAADDPSAPVEPRMPADETR